MALMIILGELDGNADNLGLIPSQEDPELYEVGKVDHDDVACGMVSPITLRSLAKIVFGEGKSYFTDFDYEKFDLNKIADAFDAIANVPDDIWGGSIVKRGKELAKENVSEEIRGYINMAEAIADIFNDRKNRCKDFAISLRCEAAVRSNDFKAIEHLIEQGFDINTPVEYIHLDTSQEKQVASLVKLWSSVTKGDSEATKHLLKYAAQNGPIPVLEMAVRYNKFELVKQLTPLSNTNSIITATSAAIEIENQEICNFLTEIIAPRLMNTKTRSDL